jgi:DNA-binding MarR family transcriptional regulator
MPLLMLKDLPRYECLLAAGEKYPTLNPRAFAAFLHLLRTGDAVFAAESDFLAQHSLSQGRFTVLMLLNRCGHDDASTPAALGVEAGVERATMTGLLDTLEKDGVVRREADARDRRTVLVRLTKAGRALLERMLPDYFECVGRIMASLNAAERKQLVALLQKIQQTVANGRRGSAHVAETAEAAACAQRS